ncbi:hypothetical protein ACEVJL_01775 [Pseudoflavonifractor sp. P01025]|uniref:hypothetical protein n=1 Tax=Flintibacter porci TaxID=3342383 RepID=UPI0035B670CA
MGGKNSPESINRYMAKAYDRINLTVPKGQKEVIKAHAEAQGESVNGFINRAIDEAMGRVAPDRAQERPQAGGLQLPAEALKTAQEAAEATGEAVSKFVERAVVDQAERDKRSWRMGINPATGKKAGE